ncbi:MAG TPA: ClbS/DfsB family four-helix bundle protein [Herpetosiphonaceae bacterium]
MRDGDALPTKHALRAEMDASLTQFLAVIDALSDDDLLIPHDDAGWSVRDHLTHLAVWADGIAALLRRDDRWAAMGLVLDPADDTEPEYDVLNAQIQRQHHHLTPAAARAQLVAAHERVAAAVDALADSDLSAPYEHFVAPFTGQEGSLIYEYILGNTAHHYDEHTPWIIAIVQGERRGE